MTCDSASLMLHNLLFQGHHPETRAAVEVAFGAAAEAAAGAAAVGAVAANALHLQQNNWTPN